MESIAGLECKNARISGTLLGIEDHGILTAFVHLDFGGSSQGFGGYNLTQTCAIFVRRVLEVVGVEKWEDLKGKPVRVRAGHCKVHAIGNFIEGKWFCPSEELEGGAS